jgi:hypothetical protein
MANNQSAPPFSPWITVPDIQVPSYAALRASSYGASVQVIFISGTGVAGLFIRVAAQADDGGIYINDSIGQTWGRVYDYLVKPEWYGFVTGASSAANTAALQTCLNTGRVIKWPRGVVNFSQLVFNTVAQQGQVCEGDGAVSAAGTGAFKTVLTPDGTVTPAIILDGTPFGTWIEGIRFRNFALDMAAFADVSTSIGIQTVKTFDTKFDGIRILNDGVNKRGWKALAGTYVSKWDTCQAQWIELIGTSDVNGVTTCVFTNMDANNVNCNYCANIKFRDGSYQGTGTRFKFRNSAAILIDTDVEGSGVYLDVDNSVSYLRSFAELQGFTGTYMVGTPGQSCILWDQQVNFNAYPASLSTGYIHLNNQGAVSNNSILSGGAFATYLDFGGAASNIRFGTAGAANDFFGGTIAGDGVVFTLGNTSFWIGINQLPVYKFQATGLSVNAQGSPQATQFVSGAANKYSYVDIARAGGDGARLAVAGAANDFINGSAAGDLLAYTVGATNLYLGTNSTLAVQINSTQQILMPVLKASASYANDAAASAGGVPVGGLYRNGSIVQIRIV